MKDIKMSDVFNLDGSIGFPAYWSDERVRAVDSIIRGHDKLKQERDEAIELLANIKRDLLERADICDDGCRVVNLGASNFTVLNEFLSKVRGE